MTSRVSNKIVIAIIVVLLVGVCASVVITHHQPKPTATPIVHPSNPVVSKEETPTFGNVTGKWTGPWTNSLGEHGNDTLEITDDGAGNFKGVWSGTINVTGQWLDNTHLKMSGRTSTRDYQVQGTVQGDTLNLNYTATRLNTSGTYTGEETLTRTQ